jgi:hypothetical protein
MSPVPSGDAAGEQRLWRQLQAAGGVPAFALRAQRTEQAFQTLLEQCRQQRTLYLRGVRWAFLRLRCLAAEPAALLPLLRDAAQLDTLALIEKEAGPWPVCPGRKASPARQRRALEELCQAIERFNRRWRNYLEQLDLTPLNALREDYNRYYLLEKECFLGSPRLARQGFQPLPPLTVDELLRLLPLLPMLLLR